MKKKIYVFVLSYLLIVSLCACGSDKKETGNKVTMGQKIKEIKLTVKIHTMVEEINDVMETVKLNDMIEIIDELNQNSDTGEIKLYQDCGWSEYAIQNYNLENPALHIAKDRTAQYYGFMYPKNSGRVCYTQLVLMDKKYHVFGIRVGDSIRDIADVMQGFGYSEQESKTPEESIVYTKENLYVVFNYEQGVINDIVVNIYRGREYEEEDVMY